MSFPAQQSKNHRAQSTAAADDKPQLQQLLPSAHTCWGVDLQRSAGSTQAHLAHTPAEIKLAACAKP